MFRSLAHNRAGFTRTSLLSSAALALTVGLASPALAQASGETQAQDTAALDEIVVVGVTKQAENLQKVPTTITAFTGEKLEAQGIRNVGEVATFTPGFNVRGMGNNPTAVAFSMRGQVQNDSLATLEPSVGTYIDDMYIARSYGLNVDMLDVSNVQVLKGPQGTLFGRNTSAGAVLIQTNDPRYSETSGAVKLTYGRFNEMTGVGVINMGLNDSVAVRAALSYSTRDGYKKDVYTGKKYEGYNTLSGRLKVGLRPTETLTLLLSGEWYDSDIDGPVRQNLFFKSAAFGTQAAADRALFNGNPNLVAVSRYGTVGTIGTLPVGVPASGPFSDIKTQTYIAKASLETAFGEIKWINGYRKIESVSLIDLEGTAVTAHWTLGSQNLKQYSSELQATGKTLNDQLDFAFGVTFFKETGFDQSRTSTAGSSTWSNFQGYIDNKSYGVYGQLSYHVTDALSLTGGLRYSSDEKGITQHSGAALNNGVLTSCTPTTASGGASLPDCARGRTDTFNNVSYSIGADYQITPDLLVFAKHSKGYRSGAQQLRSLTLTDSTPANPEIVHEQEIGFKSEFFGRRVRLNVAGYHNKVRGAQRSVVLGINGTSQTILENADMETWGAEADLTVRVTNGLNLFASGALTDPKYTKYAGFVVTGTSPSQVLTAVDKRHSRIVGVVRKQFNIGANYETDLDFGKLTLNASYAWTDKMPQDPSTYAQFVSTDPAVGGFGFSAAEADAAIRALTTRSIGITNARATLAFGPDRNYEVAIWGRNVFDERATAYTLFLGGLNYVGTSWNEPATYGVTATVKF